MSTPENQDENRSPVRTRQPITMQSIADELGLSRTTVYRVIQGSSRVAAETRNMILEAISRHDYRPNALAQNLASRKSGAIVYFLDSVTTTTWDTITDELVMLFNAESYSVNIRIGREIPLEVIDEYLSGDVRSRRIDGLIFKYGSPFLDAEVFAGTRRRIHEYGMPVVFLTRVADRNDVNFVSTDRFAGAVSIVEHLLKQGRRNIVMATVREDYAPSRTMSDEKEKGFSTAMESAAKVPVDRLFVKIGGYDYSSGYAAGERITSLRPVPEAVFCTNDLTALGLINNLVGQGIRVPDDIAVAGFNNDRYCVMSPVPITTVEQPVSLICETAYRLFSERLANPSKPCEQILLPPKLIVRDSA